MAVVVASAAVVLVAVAAYSVAAVASSVHIASPHKCLALADAALVAEEVEQSDDTFADCTPLCSAVAALPNHSPCC